MRVTLLLLLFPILARAIKEETDVDDDPPLVDGGVSTSAEGKDVRISRQASFQRGVSSGAEERRIQSISRTEKVNRLQRPTLSRKKQSFLRRRLGHRKSKLRSKQPPIDKGDQLINNADRGFRPISADRLINNADRAAQRPFSGRLIDNTERATRPMSGDRLIDNPNRASRPISGDRLIDNAPVAHSLDREEQSIDRLAALLGGKLLTGSRVHPKTALRVISLNTPSLLSDERVLKLLRRPGVRAHFLSSGHDAKESMIINLPTQKRPFMVKVPRVTTSTRMVTPTMDVTLTTRERPLKTKVKPMDDTVVEPSANIQVDPATEQQQPTTRGFSRTVPSSSSVTPSPAPTFAPRIHHRRKFMNRGQTRAPTRVPIAETPPTEEAPPTGETTPTEEATPPPLFTKPPRRIRPTRPSTLRSSFTTRRPVTMLPPSRSSSGFSRRVTEDTEIPDRRVTGTTRSFTMRPPTAPPTSRAEQVSTVSQHTEPMSSTRGSSHSMRSRLETTVTPSPSPFTRLPPPAPPRQSTPTQLPVMTHPPSPAPLFAPPTFSMPTNPSTLPSTVMSARTNPPTLSTTFTSAQTSPPTLSSSPMSASTSPHTLSSPPMTQPSTFSRASISATPHFSTFSTHPAQIPTTMGTLPPVTVTQRPHLTMPPLPTHSTHAPTSLTPPSSTHSLTSVTSSSTSSAHSASPPPTSLSTHSSPTTTADLSRNSVTEPAAPAPQRVPMVSANSPGAPGSLPPDDSVVNALNTADDFMDVARRLKLRRNARRKRMAEMQRAWYGRWGTL